MSTKSTPSATQRAAPKPKKSTPEAVRIYLILYNALSAIGWGYLLVLLVVHLFNIDGKSQILPQEDPSLVKTRLSRFLSYLSPGGDAKTGPFQTKLPAPLQPIFARAATSYSRLGHQTTIVQSFAALEVLHALLGWVRSPVPTTAAQVASRLFLTWGVTEIFTETHSNPVYASMVFAWSTTEVIRYSFYALSLLGKTSSVLLWLRYTTFYILYPLGASSEAFLILATLPQTFFPTSFHTIPAKPVWSLLEYGRGVLFTIWWPGLYVMYTYMIGQRRKVLGTPKTKGAKAQ